MVNCLPPSSLSIQLSIQQTSLAVSARIFNIEEKQYLKQLLILPLIDSFSVVPFG